MHTCSSLKKKGILYIYLYKNLHVNSEDAGDHFEYLTEKKAIPAVETFLNFSPRILKQKIRDHGFEELELTSP